MEKDACFRCGITSEVSKLSDAISKEGIVKICDNCILKEDIPVIRKPTDFQLKEAERPATVFERLSKAAGLNPEEVKKRRVEVERVREVNKQNISLRKIVEDNYKTKVVNKPLEKVQVDLMDNFHWMVMRARRAKHLTQKQLADELKVPESAIRLLEQNFLPEDNYQLIDKVEQYLGIKIRKNSPVSPQRVKWDGDFSPEKIKGLTIADLKAMKEEKKEQEPVEEKPEEKKRGWFAGLFSKSNKDNEKPEIKVEVEEIDLGDKDKN